MIARRQFYDVSAGQKYYGQDIGKTVNIYATDFPDMHRSLGKFTESGDTIVVELSLNGTHNGPLALPAGTIPPAGNEIYTPCCDVFVLKHGKVVSFHSYTAATIMLGQLGQLGVLGNLGAVLIPNA